MKCFRLILFKIYKSIAKENIHKKISNIISKYLIFKYIISNKNVCSNFKCYSYTKETLFGNIAENTNFTYLKGPANNYT